MFVRTLGNFIRHTASDIASQFYCALHSVIENLKDYFIQQLDLKEVVIEKDTSINKTIKAAKEKTEASPEKADDSALDDMEK